MPMRAMRCKEPQIEGDGWAQLLGRSFLAALVGIQGWNNRRHQHQINKLQTQAKSYLSHMDE